MSSSKKKNLKVGKVAPRAKIGSAGPTTAWLKMSTAQRERTKQYIKDAFNGYVRDDGVTVPSVRRIYSGLDAKDGFDLRHIERWSSTRLAKARNRIQSLNTLTGRPFSVITPHSKAQKREAQKFTGQNLPGQKSVIVQVQLQGRDRAVFRNGKIAIERKFPSGSKTIKSRYLFRDYLRSSESLRDTIEKGIREGTLTTRDLQESKETLDNPTTFREMREVTKRMMLDMPKNVYGQPAFYTLLTPQYGPIGRSATHGRILDLLVEYMQRYDPGGTVYKGHEEFIDQVIGFQMIGTFAQYSKYEIEQRERTSRKKKRNKLRFAVKPKDTRCTQLSAKTGARCILKEGHADHHKFKK